MADVLNHVLAHQIARNDDLPQTVLDVVELLLNCRPIQLCELEQGTDSPVLKRWSMRMASLVSPSQSVQVRTAGWQLLTVSFRASEHLLLANTKALLPQAISILAHESPDPVMYAYVVGFVTLVAATSLKHNEWAKEHVPPQTVQKLVQNMHARASSSPELLHASVEGILRLVPLFPTALRPLYQSLHDLSVSLLAADSAVSDTGARLLVQLYLLAPKGREGLQEAWKTTLESLVGALHATVLLATGDTLVEGPTTNQTLAPLALAPPPSGELFATKRIETLARCICLALRTPTSEKVGSVPVPVGAIAEIGVRLVSINAETPFKDRQDPAQMTLVRSLMPRLQLVGSQILAQLAVAIGPRLMGNESEILSALSLTLLTYSIRSPMRAALATTYSIILERLGAGVDLEEAKTSLARVWRCVLEDVGAVALETQPSSSEANGKQDAGGSRKKKRQRMYDPSEDLNKQGARVADDVLQNAEAALQTLTVLLHCQLSRFVAPELKLAAARLVLSLAIEPNFFSSSSRSERSMLFLAGTYSSTLEAARHSLRFRRRTVSCLKALCDSTSRMPGLVDKAFYVWRRAALDADDEISKTAKDALREATTLVHPAVVPLQANATLARKEFEQAGGDIGHEDDFGPSLQDFAPKAQEEKGTPAADEDAQVMSVDLQPDPQEAMDEAPQTLQPAKTNRFVSNAFSFVRKEKEEAVASDNSVEATPVMQVERSTPLVSARATATTSTRETGDAESSDDDDDRMPDIHFSDEE